MNISSILITLVGILIILALYVVGRLNQKKVPDESGKKLPKIVDDKGTLVSSVLDDIPAAEIHAKHSKETDNVSTTSNQENSQLVLFISAKDEHGLDGDLIKKTLVEQGLVLGSKDIYYFNEENDKTIFKVANGVQPWTLTDEDLIQQKLAGISLIMPFAASKNTQNDIQTFLVKTKEMALKIDGIVKDQQQNTIEISDLDTQFNTIK